MVAGTAFRKFVAVALGFGVFSAFPCAAMYVNDYRSPSPYIEVSFLKQPDSVDKTDAAMIVSYGAEGTEVFLIDGGTASGTALAALNNLRSDLLEKLGKADQVRNKDYRLRITCLVTHCHPDHVDELISMVLPNARFAVQAIYLPHATGLTTDGTFDNALNCDVNQRVKLLSSLKMHHPEATCHELAFGTVMDVPFESGNMRLYAPSTDWGVGKPLQYLIDTYYSGDGEAKRVSGVPTAVNNANSMWIRLEYQGKSFLFPGDVMKKKHLADEPFDRMIDRYGAGELRSDVVKYPHHGILRNPAAPRLVKDLLKGGADDCVIVTSRSAAGQAGVVLSEMGVLWRDASRKTVVFHVDEEGIRVR
mgnify:CR=1 FL=1